MIVQHNSTGIVLEVVKQTAKTVYMVVVANSANINGLKVGDKQKTNPSAIGVTYTVL